MFGTVRLNGPSIAVGSNTKKNNMEKPRLVGYKTWMNATGWESDDGDESQLIGIPFSFLKKNPRKLGTMNQVSHLVRDD